METFDAIHTRRSIRKFLDKKVDDDTIKKILSAAMTAPSAMNEQPWQFVVILDKEVLAKVSTLSPYQGMAKDAAAAILICGDTSLENPKAKGFWVQDCSAAIQNMLLAMTDLGLGGVWCGIYPFQPIVENYRNTFNLPENIIPLALIPFGYPAEEAIRKDRYKDERVRYDGW